MSAWRVCNLHTPFEAVHTRTHTVAASAFTTFTLRQDTTPVLGTVVYAGVTAVFTPVADLAANEVYTATITTGAEDEAGNGLAEDYTWTFTTGDE